jgi:hypothetical protein
MSIYAVIVTTTNICDNAIVLDEGSQWSPPEDHYISNIDGLSATIGWHYEPATQVWTAPPTVSAAFSPAPIFLGQETTLLWSSTDATSVSLSTDPGVVFDPNGSKAYVPPSIGKTIVTVTANGLAGSASYTATVTVYGTQSEMNSDTVFV